jgi:hypothetical protein
VLNGDLVVFSGCDMMSSGGDCYYEVDTWAWDGANWAQLTTTGPPARCGAAATTMQ